jgi:hypothetical protein
MKRKISILFSNGAQMSRKYKMSVAIQTAVNNTIICAKQEGRDMELIKTIKVGEIGD